MVGFAVILPLHLHQQGPTRTTKYFTQLICSQFLYYSAREYKPKVYARGLHIALLCLAFFSSSIHAAATLDLSGRWNFRLDPQDAGVDQKWFDKTLQNKISLPGILESQGYGDEIGINTPWVLSLYDHYWFERYDYKQYTTPGSVKVPFLAQPPRHYSGVAWYQRDVFLPKDWTGKMVELFLERPHWGNDGLG